MAISRSSFFLFCPALGDGDITQGRLAREIGMDSLKLCIDVLRALALQSANPNSYLLAEREISDICEVQQLRYKNLVNQSIVRLRLPKTMFLFGAQCKNFARTECPKSYFGSGMAARLSAPLDYELPSASFRQWRANLLKDGVVI